MRHRGDWWVDEPAVRAAFGAAIAGDLEGIRRASRFLQAEGLRVAVEAARRAWPRTAGTLPWQLGESFPNAWSTAAIDHDGRPRPAYHAVRRAYLASGAAAWMPSPALGGARQLEGRAWGWCEHVAAVVAAGLRIEIRTADGRGAARGSWPASEAAKHRLRPSGVVGPVRWALHLPEASDDPATRVLVLDVALDVEPGTVPDGHLPARYLLTRATDLAPLGALPATRLETQRTATGLVIRNAGRVLAPDVHIALPTGPDGVPAVLLDDAFHLLPGEEHQVEIAWRAVPREARQVTVDAWNAPAVTA
jgi:beta-mannosidase